MFKITLSILCEKCDATHDLSVVSKVVDPMAWQSDAWTLQSDAESIGWDFYKEARCQYCSGANGELFRDHPGDYYGQLVRSADGVEVEF